MDNSIIEIYQIENGDTEISVILDHDTVWLNLFQLTELFQRDKSVISRHISNIFQEKELDLNSVVAKNATTAIAISKPEEKSTMIKVIVNLINKKN